MFAFETLSFTEHRRNSSIIQYSITNVLIKIIFPIIHANNGIVGCYFTKFAKDKCEDLDINGWVKNSKAGTIIGKMQGPKPSIDIM